MVSRSSIEIFIVVFVGVFVLVGLIAPILPDLGTNLQVIFGSLYQQPTNATLDICPGWRDCWSCTFHYKSTAQCGWCKNLNECKHGTQTGPDDGSCSYSDWVWFSGQCPTDTCSGNRGICQSSCSSDQENLGKLDCYVVCCRDLPPTETETQTETETSTPTTTTSSSTTSTTTTTTTTTTTPTTTTSSSTTASSSTTSTTTTTTTTTTTPTTASSSTTSTTETETETTTTQEYQKEEPVVKENLILTILLLIIIPAFIIIFIIKMRKKKTKSSYQILYRKWSR